MKTKAQKIVSFIISVIAIIGTVIVYYTNRPSYSASVADVPAYDGNPYVVINGNDPEFGAGDLSQVSYENYSELDYLGRCGYVMACIGKDIMPTQERESISHIKPSGWVQAQYSFVDGENLYNRCHLIGFQLTGENANERNLITGTRYLNVEGMLPFENMVADYVKETDNHVLYRVTPIFEGEELVARGVQMEAFSVEDDGQGICFNVYAYNVQPGVQIDYATGFSALAGTQDNTEPSAEAVYILNLESKKFHSADCKQAENIADDNKEIFSGDRQILLDDGYVAAGCCKP